ncbi:hypothetical protein Aduo_005846 [Ancylostoma duodenale]
MEMRILRWTHGITRLDRVRNEDVRSLFEVAPITAKMREARLRWYSHLTVNDVYDRRKWRNRTRNADLRRWETG